MIILALTLTAWAILRKYAQKPARRAATPVYAAPTVLSPAEIKRREKERERAQREAERQRKAEQQKAQWRIEYEHRQLLREQYKEQYTDYEKRLSESTLTEKQRDALRNKIFTTGERMYKNDLQLVKLYDKINN